MNTLLTDYLTSSTAASTYQRKITATAPLAISNDNLSITFPSTLTLGVLNSDYINIKIYH